jgi:hypothetical protein
MYLRDFNNKAHWKTEKTFGVLYYEGWGYYIMKGGGIIRVGSVANS